ncbi:hypothetical protein FIBSPDRAFT_846657 [Athelia psychrophila]|uniref:DUF924-domain-containing protein n=1 Tax=Athelia psychrophila TaxID=1759441 RepID=A0A166X8I3_9AGAM|nr:hypothetical protein FIBSPDRAFT_846657 [Fibularhizoctonia sp. CBS 109695]
MSTTSPVAPTGPNADAPDPDPADAILRRTLTPALLTAVLALKIPFPSDAPLDFATAFNTYFRGAADAQAFTALALPALKALSQIPPAALPSLSLLAYLPAPESPEFPAHALGLILLLDQGGRVLLSGVDARWCNAFFDPLAQRLAEELYALPEALRPWQQARWVGERGVHVEYWLVAVFWFVAPFIHSEALPNHHIALALLRSIKSAVAALAPAAPDPYDTPEIVAELRTDPTAFARRVTTAPGGAVAMPAYVYWFCMLMETHPVIIEKFGRYPYRNGAVGREDTEAEARFVRETNGFGAVDEETRREIRADVERGIWRPIQAVVG